MKFLILGSLGFIALTLIIRALKYQDISQAELIQRWRDLEEDLRT